MRKIVFIFLLFGLIQVSAQQTSNFVKGRVMEMGEESPLPGASVFWLGTNKGGITNNKGDFKIPSTEKTDILVISYTGFQSDTIQVTGNDLKIYLRSSVELDEVEIVSRVKTTNIGYMDPIKIQNIGEGELHKAACCNLSESFETNPSVDVSFTDAVTGTKQIQMLGLAGPYTQITRENMPDIRGLSAIYGLTYTPGAWISGIQLIKGTGSVVNGYESIAGQINVNLWSPESSDRLYLNLFANQEGRLEANVTTKFNVGKKWKSALLLHGKTNQIRNDMNDDGFMDMPIGSNFIGLNRWEYQTDGGHIEIGVKGTYIDQLGGQTDYNQEDKFSDMIWGMQNQTKRLEAWTKTGKVFKDKPYKSFGLQLSGIYHDQESVFGLREYNGLQKSFYANFIYQSIISNTNHKFKLGSSFTYDDYQETFNHVDYSSSEMVPGVFAEYTYNWNDRFNLVAGIRGDYSDRFGFFATPRLHLRYLMTENLILRASVGRGQRTARIISENIGLLSSSRVFNIQSVNADFPYGLDAEVAWNYGLNLTLEFELDYRDGLLSFDFYRTDFQNQIVIDVDSDIRQVSFYNLEGSSYSNSFQAQLDYEVLKRVDMRIAYRWYDVKTTYNGDLMEKPFVSANRAFINLAYESRNYWMFDATLNWQGQKRLPSTAANPLEYQREDHSPDFFLLNAQITKSWNQKFDVYIGVNNLLNYKQEHPIVASDEAFSEYFDASMVWGPIYGRNIYLGLRYRIP